MGRNAGKYLQKCINDGWVSYKGEFGEKFEEKFARWTEVKYAVAVSSGTAAIHLALAALNIGPGDEVIVPGFTMIASVLPIIYVGGKTGAG